MELRVRTSGLLLLASLLKPAEAVSRLDPETYFTLDTFFGLYALIITGLVIKEAFFTARRKAADEGVYSNRVVMDDDSLYMDLTKRTDGEYKQLPVRTQRHGKNQQVYQDLSSATKGVYDSLPVKPLPAAH